jgi:2-polyprenyl-6-methoxyphenol hydroxylase-like FAD-dependent oxidoreductase
VLVEVDPDHRQMREAAQIREYFCHEATQLAGRTVETDQVRWGGNYLSFVQNRQADHMTAGDNVVLFGDAARTGFAWSSGGANLCMVDVQNVDRLVDDLSSGKRQEGLERFEWRTRYTGEAWLIAGANEFGSGQPGS